MRTIELRTDGLAAIAAVTRRGLAGHMLDHATAIDLEQTIAGDHLDDPHVSAGIEFRAKRLF